MWSRKRIDIRWSDLLFGYRCTFSNASRTETIASAEAALFDRHQSLATLSVRSGFDLLLRALQLPEGSEVIVSAVTIRDMAVILESHGLTPVPADLNSQTMAPDLETIRNAVTEKTVAVLFAHLFGAIIDLEEIVDFAKARNLLFIEDCAQAFDGPRYQGHPQADVVMFSFGPIKTATALAGGIVLIRDPQLLERMRELHSQLPVQTDAEFRRRVKTYMLLKLVAIRPIFGLLIRLLRLRGKDPDEALSDAVRNFPAEQFFPMLRRQPSTSLLQLMHRRLSSFDMARQDQRSQRGKELRDDLRHPMILCPGADATRHTWWVFPVVFEDCVDTNRLITNLRQSGFDATASNALRSISAPRQHAAPPPATAEAIAGRMVFLPFYPELPPAAAREMATRIKRAMPRPPEA